MMVVQHRSDTESTAMSAKGKKENTKISGKDPEVIQTKGSVEVSEHSDSTSFQDTDSATPGTDERTVDLTTKENSNKEKAIRMRNKKRNPTKDSSGVVKDKEEEVAVEDVLRLNKGASAEKESRYVKYCEEDVSKSRKVEDVIKSKNKNMDKTVKSSKTLDLTGKKNKGLISKKKVRSVQDQEKTEKKQTSLSDHFQVRRSERKLKTVGDDEARRALQKQILSGIEDGLEIKVIEEKGRGIFASQNFAKACIVCEYAGELIDYQEAKERESEYEKTPEIGSYMYYFLYKDKKYCVDATKETSRLGRLLNHSKTNSNVYTKVFPINDVPYLILVASRDIECGEELLYDYGDRSKTSVEYHPWLKS